MLWQGSDRRHFDHEHNPLTQSAVPSVILGKVHCRVLPTEGQSALLDEYPPRLSYILSCAPRPTQALLVLAERSRDSAPLHLNARNSVK